MSDPDADLVVMPADALRAEVRKLRAAVRAHRDSTGHDLCWHHPALWGALPEHRDVLPTVPPWCEFMQRCAQYRQSLEAEREDGERPPATPPEQS